MTRVFQGTHTHAVDAKGRTSLPARFRELISAQGTDVVYITKGPGRALWCYPPEEWKQTTGRLREKSSFDKKVRDFVNAFVSPAQDCTFDKLGRVLIPADLRAWAGLGEEVVWAGANDHIEIWSTEGWKKRQEELESVLESDPFADGAL